MGLGRSCKSRTSGAEVRLFAGNHNGVISSIFSSIDRTIFFLAGNLTEPLIVLSSNIYDASVVMVGVCLIANASVVIGANFFGHAVILYFAAQFEERDEKGPQTDTEQDPSEQRRHRQVEFANHLGAELVVGAPNERVSDVEVAGGEGTFARRKVLEYVDGDAGYRLGIGQDVEAVDQFLVTLLVLPLGLLEHRIVVVLITVVLLTVFPVLSLVVALIVVVAVFICH